MEVITYNNDNSCYLQYLPIEVLSYIQLYLDIKFDIITIFTDNDKLIVKKKYTVPSKICLVSKFWYNAILFSRCRTCTHGRYDRLNSAKFRCMACGHVLESKDTVAKRALKMRKMVAYVDGIYKRVKKIDT